MFWFFLISILRMTGLVSRLLIVIFRMTRFISRPMRAFIVTGRIFWLFAVFVFIIIRRFLMSWLMLWFLISRFSTVSRFIR
ncbi:unnamed protein product [Larinioides sclopetarius]|uniref:ATP synthase F0 subunit 8 n=1 Tax=Larinioides sclopetarius TaxID=280406 RepID=A0AAV2AXW8_9ARAC